MTPSGQPDARYFAVMAEVAASHWWYVARRELFRQLLAGRVTPGATALDVGCGTGETMTVLRELGATRVAGTDLSDEEHNTIGGAVIAHLGRLPRRGESLAFAGLRVQVLRADSRRVYTLIVEKPKT